MPALQGRCIHGARRSLLRIAVHRPFLLLFAGYPDDVTTVRRGYKTKQMVMLRRRRNYCARVDVTAYLRLLRLSISGKRIWLGLFLMLSLFPRRVKDDKSAPA